MRQFFLFHVVILFLCSANADSSNEDNILRFKNYLKNIDSIAADFTQTDSQGVWAKGKLLISKPYKFRCNYYFPFPLLIVGNKNYVSVYDYDMEQLSRIKTEENVFGFLLTNNVEIDKNFDFESFEEDKDIFTVTLYHSSTSRRSSVRFDKIGKRIKSLEVFEDDNHITINFDSIKQVTNFQEDLFNIRNPDSFGIPKRLEKSEIEKKYELVK
ncbi:MAG: LolA family protein [Janthinobacterium lividum]